MMEKSCFNCEKYKELKVKDGVYVPEIATQFPDDDASKRIVEAKIVKEIVFDETYPYYETTSAFRWFTFKYDLKTYLCSFLNWLLYGMKVEGKDILKKHEKEFENGAITVANHQYRWDVPGIRVALGFRKIWIPAWAETFKTKDGNNLKGARCIPIPDTKGGVKKFNEAIDQLHEEKQWFHIFPEGTRWDFYKPFKPFHKTAFVWAYKYNIPIVPMVYTHRPRTGWRKLFCKGEPLMTLTVLEPLWADKSLPRKEATNKLREEAWTKMLEAAGIEHNPWNMIPDVD